MFTHIAHILSSIVVFLLLAGCGHPATVPAPTPTPELAGELKLAAPAAIQASEPARVHVLRSDAPDGLAVTLVAQGSYGARLYQAHFARGKAQVVLPGDYTRQSGQVSLIATAGAARGETTLDIQPGPPVEPVTPLAGPRSIMADGKHSIIVVAIPFDRYGNPVAEGTWVKLHVLYPDAQPQVRMLRVHHLLAWQQITSGTRAGRTTLSVSCGNAYGPAASFLQVPGWPLPFALSAAPLGLPADGRQFVTLRTEPIQDRFGNQMLDGTLVTFVVDMPANEPRFIPAYTIDGVAEAQLQVPDQPGTISVRATLYGVESQPLRLTFGAGPAVGTFPLTAHVNARDDQVILAAGPLLGDISQFVPEGSPVRFTLTTPDGTVQVIEGIAEQGHARVELRLASLVPGHYTVEARIGSGYGQTSFRVP